MVLGWSDSENLQAQLLHGEHLKLLRRYLEVSTEVSQLLRRLLDGDRLRYHTPLEDHLYWLGVLAEHDTEQWNWAAPVLADWARQE